MTIYGSTVRMHAQRLTEATAQATALARSLRTALGRAHSYADPNLTPEALQAKREGLAREFRAAAENDLTKLRDDIEASRRYLDGAARENAALASDPAALIQAEQKWRQVQTMLDAGIDLRQILSTADEPTTRAIAEFGPSWATAKDYRPDYLQDHVGTAMYGGEEFSVSGWVQRVAYQRLAQVTPDPDLSELLTAASTAERNIAPARPYLDAAQSLVTNGSADMMSAGVASHLAASDAL